jgi:hypothetical protein
MFVFGVSAELRGVIEESAEAIPTIFIFKKK